MAKLMHLYNWKVGFLKIEAWYKKWRLAPDNLGLHWMLHISFPAADHRSVGSFKSKYSFLLDAIINLCIFLLGCFFFLSLVSIHTTISYSIFSLPHHGELWTGLHACIPWPNIILEHSAPHFLGNCNGKKYPVDFEAAVRTPSSRASKRAPTW